MYSNGEPLLKLSLSYSHSFKFATILLVLCSANDDGRALPYKASSNLLNEDTYRSVCVGNHSCGQIEQGAQYLLNKERVYEESSGRSSL